MYFEKRSCATTQSSQQDYNRKEVSPIWKHVECTGTMSKCPTQNSMTYAS
jgi:hypothetical protein